MIHAYWINVTSGRRERVENNGDIGHGVRCSNCGEGLVGSEEYAVKANYCPNCGAEMRERSNGKQRAMISLPMRGKDEETISREWTRVATKLIKSGFEVIDSRIGDYFSFKRDREENGENVDIAALSFSIYEMAKCDALILANGWGSARGCRIERKIAKEYGLEVFDEYRIEITGDSDD